MLDNVTFDVNVLISESVGGKRTQGQGKKKNPDAKLSVADYEKKAKETSPAVVIGFSGALDNQTAADVGDASKFELQPVHGPEKAGGATTNSLHWVLKQNNPNLTYSKLLVEMHHLLKKEKYSQIPSVSTSRQMNLLTKKFSVTNPLAKPGSTRRALIIGINYYGTGAQLDGCLNDCKMQIRWLRQEGWPVDDPNFCRIISDKKPDDNSFRTDMRPTGENIVKGLEWLVKGAKDGDSLFLHYSGHGSQLPEIPDEDGNYHEDDKLDETMVPEDYKANGQIRDDTLFKILVPSLPDGVQLICFMDCCHSGSILDLSYQVTVNDELLAKLEKAEAKKENYQAMVQQASNDGTAPPPEEPEDVILMDANPDFNFDFAKKLIKQVYDGGFEAMPEVWNTIFEGPEARARSRNLQMCCFNLCFGGEANGKEVRAQRRKDKEAQWKNLPPKNTEGSEMKDNNNNNQNNNNSTPPASS